MPALPGQDKVDLALQCLPSQTKPYPPDLACHAISDQDCHVMPYIAEPELDETKPACPTEPCPTSTNLGTPCHALPAATCLSPSDPTEPHQSLPALPGLNTPSVTKRAMPDPSMPALPGLNTPSATKRAVPDPSLPALPGLNTPSATKRAMPDPSLP